MEKYVQKVNYGTTVCQSIAQFYSRDYGFYINEVVMNLPCYNDLKPSPCPQNKIRMVYHGVANRTRGMFNMIDIFRKLDARFTLDFFIINQEDNVYHELVNYARDDSKIKFNKPVPTKDLPGTLNKFDIGFYALQNVVPNQEFALPNKFFEFIQARLAIAIWPSVEMANILKKYKLGVVSDQFCNEGLATKLNALSADDINIYKNNANIAARLFHNQDSINKIRKGVGFFLSEGR